MIWFDFDNSPHIPLFQPVINVLEQMNLPVFLTARDFAQTKELLSVYNMNAQVIGAHGGKEKWKKLINLWQRSSQLIKTVKSHKVSLSVSHGSRTQLLASKRLGIPSLLMMDYEYTESTLFNLLSTYMLWPEYIPDERLDKAGINLKKVRRYNGFKEELYLSQFKPDPDFRKQLNIDEEQILVVIRTPAMVGNYHNDKSEMFALSAIRHFSKFENVLVLISTRTSVDDKYIKNNIRQTHNIRFLKRAVNGLQLLYAADYAISAGGTMNRESALLGTKTYSIFTGRRPYLDEYLEAQGKMIFVDSENVISDIIPIRDRQKFFDASNLNSNLASDVAKYIMELANE